MALVSVVVPVYNVEQYLERCIESLLVQTLQTLEIILVNDGSTDTSGQICEAYAKKDTRIKVIHKVNGGLSDARNIGIGVARGKYIGFLDSDDWVTNDCYEYLYQLIQQEDAQIAQCDYIKAYNEYTEGTPYVQEEKKCYTGLQALEKLFEEENIKAVVVWNKLYERKLFNGIRFPQGKLHEDEFTTYKVFHKANKIVISNLQKVYYRQREASIMSQKFTAKRLDVLEAWEEKRSYFLTNGLYALAKRTEADQCSMLKSLYIQVQQSDLDNKKETLRYLKQHMVNEFISFWGNPYIHLQGKVTLSICLLNGSAFCKLYDTLYRKDAK